MAKVLVISGHIRSKVLTTAELCRRLRAEGHDVTLVLPEGEQLTIDGVAQVTMEFKLRLGPRDPNVSRFSRIVHGHRVRRARREAALRAVRPEKIHDLVRERAPEVILIDHEYHEFVIAAANLGVPIVLMNTFFNVWKRPGVPPLHTDIVPGIGVRGSAIGIEWAWLRYRLRLLTFRVRLAFGGGSHLALLRAYAARNGVDLDRRADTWQGLLPIIYRDYPVLVLVLRELDLPHEPLSRCHYVGPMIGIEQRDEEHADDTPDDVAAVLDRVRSARENEPRKRVIYCALGAYVTDDDRRFWRELASAVEREPDWLAVFGLGGRLTPADIAPLPVNVLALSWAPQTKLLELADCAVIHAGTASIHECVRFSVPMVIYPYRSYFDQKGNASRVVYHRLGVVGNIDSDRSDQMHRHVNRILEEDGFRERVARMSAHLNNEALGSRAVRLIERFAAEAQPDAAR